MARRLAAASRLRLRATFEWRVSGDERASIFATFISTFSSAKNDARPRRNETRDHTRRRQARRAFASSFCVFAGGTQRLARLVGSSRAKELIFTAATFDATYAHSIGLVGEIVDDDAYERAVEIARRILKKCKQQTPKQFLCQISAGSNCNSCRQNCN